MPGDAEHVGLDPGSAPVLIMHDIIRLVGRTDGRTDRTRVSCRRPDSRCVEHIITTLRDGVTDGRASEDGWWCGMLNRWQELRPETFNRGCQTHVDLKRYT